MARDRAARDRAATRSASSLEPAPQRMTPGDPGDGDEDYDIYHVMYACVCACVRARVRARVCITNDKFIYSMI
jgi:hypothetical protein